MRMIEYGHLSERRDKRGNEDRVWTGRVRLRDGTKVTLACVADGVSGGRNGGEVAEMTVSFLKDQLRQSVNADLESGEQARDWVAKWGAELQSAVRTRYPSGYCTLSAVVVVRDSMLVLQIGDSAIFWVPFSGGVVRLTADHSVAATMLRDGKREEDLPELAYKALDRAVGKNAVEDSLLLDVDVFPAPAERGWLVAGSDGVFDYIGGIDMRDIGFRSRFAGEMGSRLMHASLREGRNRNEMLDNASLAVVGVKQPATPMFRRTVNGMAAALIAVLFFSIVFSFSRSKPSGRPTGEDQLPAERKVLEVMFYIEGNSKSEASEESLSLTSDSDKGDPITTLIARLEDYDVEAAELYESIRVSALKAMGGESNPLLIRVEWNQSQDEIVFTVDSSHLNQGAVFVLTEDGGEEREFKFQYDGQNDLQKVTG